MDREYKIYSPGGAYRVMPLNNVIDAFDHWIFDADGTLRRCTVPEQPCPNKPGEWELIPEAVEFLKQIDWREKYASIVSNQGGVELGYLSEIEASGMLKFMIYDLSVDHRIYIQHLSMCPFNDKSDLRRKPNPGMLNEAINAYRAAVMINDPDLVIRTTLMIGDMESDKLAAENAGVCFAWAQELFEFTCASDKTE